jgi:L,D-transpeptidase catalytic domain
VIILNLILIYFCFSEVTTESSPLRQRLSVPSYSQQDSRSVGWTPRSSELKNVYIKLYLANEVDRVALRNAFEFYEKNSCSSEVRRGTCCRNMSQQTMAISDFTRPSNENRLHLINLRTGTSTNMLVAHGSGSDSNHDRQTDSYSNQPNSNQTPAGFHIARGQYMGKNGLSLNLHGLEPSRNGNSYRRRIVVHGASYVRSGGRSHGCLAVEPQNIRSVVEMLSNDSLVYNFNGETSINATAPELCAGAAGPQ